MIILQNQARHRRACTVFLVLSNDHAYWLRMHDDQIVDKYAESTLDGMSNCPWIEPDVSAEDGLVVRLLLDSPLDEIDRVSVAQTASSGANKWRSLRVLNRKKQEYAHSTVYALDKKYSPIIGSVLHHVVPPGWDQWLEHIQSRDVIVASVSNCIELMSRWSKSINHPVLLVQSSDTQQLQVLVENGSPVFSRQVDTLYAKSVESDDGCNNEELLQTIEFLKRNVLPDNEAFSVATLRSTRDASTCQWAHVYFLIDLLVLRESVVIPVPNFTEYWQPLQELVQDKDDTDSNGWPASVARFSLGLLGRLKRSMPGESSVEQRLWHGLDSLKISSAHWRSCTRLNYMRCVSLLFAASGVVCVALASVSGIASARIRTDQLLKQSDLQALRMEREVLLFEKFTNPYHMASSSVLAKEHQQLAINHVSSILPMVATAITRVPSAQLERLVWSHVDSRETAREQSLSSASPESRKVYWADVDTSVLVVGLSGTILGESLYQQKNTLDVFVDVLQANSSISSVLVLESPVDAAMNNEHSVQDASAFHIKLIVGNL